MITNLENPRNDPRWLRARDFGFFGIFYFSSALTRHSNNNKTNCRACLAEKGGSVILAELARLAAIARLLR